MKKYTGIFILLLISAGLKAQTENNSERLITQLKKGTAPGLVLAKNVPAANTVRSVAKAPNTGNVRLASEQEMVKEARKIVVPPPVVPNQDEPKKESPQSGQ